LHVVDIILILLIGLCLYFAVSFLRKRKGGCGGHCEGCPHSESCRKKENGELK